MMKFYKQNEKGMTTDIENIDFTTKAEHETRHACQENGIELGNLKRYISKYTSRIAADIHSNKIEKSEVEFFSI